MDINAFLSGSLRVFKSQELSLLSLLTGEVLRASETDLRVLFHTRSDSWTPIPQIIADTGADVAALDRLTASGILLSDRPIAHCSELRRRNRQLEQLRWEPSAALYYVMGRWKDNRSAASGIPMTREELAHKKDDADRIVERRGPPPPAFASRPDARKEIPLPLKPTTGGLYDLLTARKTTRFFDEEKALAFGHLSTILYYTVGCHGYKRLGRKVTLLKKTSPSAGALHPIEAYILALNVERLDVGLYHYNVERHSLEMIKALDLAAARKAVTNVTAGQEYLRSVHVLTILTARFYRHFWKYTHHKKAYKAIVIDAGHISQSLYLVCADLGLGAFFTAAINEVIVEEMLDLDFLDEGVIGACGFGIPARDGFDLTLDALPYWPGRTILER